MPIKSGSRRATLKLAFSYLGRTPQRPTTVAFEISTTNAQPVWADFDGYLRWQENGGTVPVRATLREPKFDGKNYQESIVCAVPVSVVKILARSLQVAFEFRGKNELVAFDSYRLRSPDLGPLRALASSIPSDGLDEKDRAHVIAIPFEPLFDYIVVQATVNETGPYNFIVDTGATTSGISRKLAAEMKLTLDGKEQGSGGGGKFDITFTNDVTVHVGVLRLDFPKMAVVPIENISPHMGVRIDGIIGYDFLGRMALEIDYDRNFLLLHNAATYSAKPEKGSVVLPMTLTNSNLVTIPLTLSHGGKSFTGNFMIDSGADASVSVSNAFAKRTGLEHLVPEKVKILHGSSGATINGSIQDSAGGKGRITEAKVGHMTVPSPVVYFAGAEGASEESSNDGLIGSALLRQFRVVLDYSRKRLILTKSRRFGLPDNGIHSGLIVVAEGDEFYPFKVEGVVGKSAAAAAGLLVGDSIVAIDNVPTKGMTLHVVLKRLERENHESNLTIERAGATLQVKLRPRQLL